MRSEYGIEGEISCGRDGFSQSLSDCKGLGGLYTVVLRVDRSVSHMKMSPHRALLNFTMFETYNLRVFVGKNNIMLKIQKLVSKMITYLECGRKLQQIMNSKKHLNKIYLLQTK